MKIEDVLNTYLKSKGMRMIKGDRVDATPLLPLLMMDCAYQMFNTYIKPMVLKQKMKQFRNLWLENYNKFNKSFFSCFNEEQESYVIDMMDEFDADIYKDIQVAFWQFMAIIPNEPIDKRKALSACMMISIFCQSAQIIWGTTYKTSKGNEQICGEIKACENSIVNLKILLYGKGKEDVNPNTYKNITDAVDILCKKMIKFLYKYVERNEETTSRG